ncbi:MAG: ribonuclease HII [Methanobacteriota archaeon]|nr:MAG: ribonuclease HII [Euryarchaeota archaeon]
MDEAGRGPVLGPLVIGLVAATPSELAELREIGVDDSKALTEKKRIQLAESIRSAVSIAKVLVVPASELNVLMTEKTLNQIEVIKFRQLLQPYASKVSKLFLDAADVNAERFGNHFTDLVDDVVAEHKADSKYEIVAAASILAKTERDRQMQLLQKEYAKKYPDLPSFGKGYPTNARNFLEEYYRRFNEMPNIARIKWKTVQKIIEKFPQTNLDEFL